MKCNAKLVEMVSGPTLISARQFLLQPQQMCWMTPPLLTSVHRMANSVYKAHTQSNKPPYLLKFLQRCTDIFCIYQPRRMRWNYHTREIFKVLKMHICLNRMKLFSVLYDWIWILQSLLYLQCHQTKFSKANMWLSFGFILNGPIVSYLNLFSLVAGHYFIIIWLFLTTNIGSTICASAWTLFKHSTTL